MLFKTKIVYLFFFFATIPWVSFQTNSLDSQPWPIFLSLLVLLLLSREKFKRYDIIWILIPLFCFFIILVNPDTINVDIIRSILNYFFFFIVLFALIIARNTGVDYLKVIYFANIIYLVVSLLQFFIDPYIFEFLVSVRTTEKRGVTSLTPEPTFFGMYLLITNMMYLFYYNYNMPSKIALIFKFNIVFIFVFSMSTMAVMYVFIGMSLLFIVRLNFKKIVYLLLLISVAFLLFEYVLRETRVYDVFSSIFDIGILSIVQADASINDRVSNVVIPLYAAFFNGFLPHGYGVFTDSYRFFVEYFDGFFWYGSGIKIQSFINNFVYELGFLSFIIFLIVFFRFFVHRRWGVLESMFLVLILFSAFPVASSLIPLLLLTALGRGYEKT